MFTGKCLVSIILVVYYLAFEAQCFNLYLWTKSGEKLCNGSATKQQLNRLLSCDKLMRDERKTLLKICLKQSASVDLNDNLPKICSYHKNEKDFKIMDCMFNKTEEIYGQKYKPMKNDEEIDSIDELENDFDWCVMKASVLFGFEHLCDAKSLTNQQLSSVKKCESSIVEWLKVLTSCRTEAKLSITNQRPQICDYYESTKVQKCWIKKSGTLNEKLNDQLRDNYIVSHAYSKQKKRINF